MEGLVVMSFWRNKRVLITGHTGFKGSWLSLWLQQSGADVCGYSLEAPTTPSLFVDARVREGMRSVIADIRDLEILRSVFADFRPEVAIHMAAQPLVRASYDDPLNTYAVNVMGTVTFLEAVRSCDAVRSVVVITTDKCYENKEWHWGYRESDALGGYDPYSNSKACAELLVSSYRNSFFDPEKYDRHKVGIATVRAGNVIGGGDWAVGRLLPDILHALGDGRKAVIRNPAAIRPWQHVMEPLRGYLTIAQRLYEQGVEYGQAWNFGPTFSDTRPVEWIVSRLTQMWGETAQWELDDKAEQPHEARVLRLDCSKAAIELGWQPRLSLDVALEITVDWYKARLSGKDMRAFTIEQIEWYEGIRKSATVTSIGHDNDPIR
jgi:CDP-glucose 4,6-dehydratase